MELTTTRGRMGFKWVALFLATALLLSLSMATLATVAKANVIPTLRVVNAPINLGGKLVISGAGFCADEQIALWVTAPDGEVWDAGYVWAAGYGSKVASNAYAGTFSNFEIDSNSTHYKVLKNLVPGTWQITAYGLTSGQTAVAPFLVEATQAGAGSEITGCPAYCVDTVNSVVFGVDFSYGEKIAGWVTRSDGKIYYALAGVDAGFYDPTSFSATLYEEVIGLPGYIGIANSNGDVVLEPLSFPYDAGFTYTLTLKGLSSGAVVVLDLNPTFAAPWPYNGNGSGLDVYK